ncbi:MAG: sarcosine oxidase subunit gamma family protein [Halofilum sp. (in: g-proteobacteria)]|nr:sarcosine oxidase subunit gamma family protein [Halofilum sp. (in: g-proteobacteria)]
MSEQIRQESPLVERVHEERRAASPADAGVTLTERPFVGFLNLRGDSDDTAFTRAVREVTGLDLPVEPNTFVENDEFGAIWLGPNEWYVTTPVGDELPVLEKLESALAGQHFAVNDLTSGLTTVRLSGTNARDLLEKGCTLDLHPRSFGSGQCAQTLVAKSGALILYRSDEPTFELVIRRSFADYLFVWLEDAAAEYGLAVG